MAANPDEMRVPLSPLDINGPDMSGITTGYVLEPGLDIAALRAALARTVDKWRLLAGRPIWDETAHAWHIRVPPPGTPLPTSPPPFRLTFARRAEPLSGVQRVHARSAALLACPPLAHFRDPAAVWALRDVAARGWPLVAVHVTHFANYDCVGVSVPHALFDAVGAGQVLGAIDAELYGREWKVPPIYSGENPVSAAMRKLEEAPAVYDGEPASLTRLKRTLLPKEPDGLQQFMQRMEQEWKENAVEYRAVYLGEQVVKTLVNRTNVELAKTSNGKVRASTGDVLLAWFLKAAHSEEANDNQLLVVPYISMRPALTEASGIDLSTYSHNCKYLFAFPPLTINTLRTTPLPDLAATSRQALLAARQTASVQALLHWRARTGSLLDRRPGTDSWLVSNQSIGQFAKIDFGVETVAFWGWTSSVLQVDHILTLNRFKGGYVLQAPMRRARWSAVEKALEELQGPSAGVTVHGPAAC